MVESLDHALQREFAGGIETEIGHRHHPEERTDRDNLDASGAVAALIRCPVRATDDELSGAIARTDRIPLPTHRHRAAAVVARRDAVGVRDGHLAGATHRQVGRATDARRSGINESNNLAASISPAILIHGHPRARRYKGVAASHVRHRIEDGDGCSSASVARRRRVKRQIAHPTLVRLVRRT